MHEDHLEEEGGPAGRIGPVGRRDFLRMALGASAVALVGGCTPSQPQPTTAPAAPAAKAPAAPAAAAPKPTGTLTVVVAKIGNANYVPKRFNDEALQIAAASFAEPFLMRKQDRSPGPGLAESFTVTPDGKTLTFNLRKGIKWHDGTELTSADVKFTIEHIIDKDSQNHDVGLWRDAVESVDAPNPQQAVLHLKAPNIMLPFRVTGPGAAFNVVFSKSYIERVGESEAAQKPVGTGPWKFVEFKTGELVRFEAVENHWRKTPAFKELVIRQVPEESTRVSMVLRGEADLAQVTMGSAKRLQEGGVNLFVDPNAYPIYISLQGLYLPSRPTFNPKVPWAADPADKQAWERSLKVRKAMNLAVDRQTIIDKFLFGQGSIPTYLHSVPGSAFNDPSWKPIPYDPDQAKRLLAEAGYPNGFEFPLLLAEQSARPGSVQIGEAVGQYWQAIGLRPKLSPADFAATIQPGTAAYSLAGTAYSGTRPTYDEPVVAEAGAIRVVAEYAPMNDLVAKALQTVDFEERKKLNIQMGQMHMDTYLSVPVVWVNGLWGGSKRVKDFPRIPGTPGLYNFEYAVPA